MKVISWCVVALLSGCKSDECAGPDHPSCIYISCGDNSPLINAFPVHSFRSTGECSIEGVKMRPKSMKGGACDGATLDIEGTELVGRKGDKIVCRGDELKGATFEVRSFKKKNAAIKIADVVRNYPHATDEFPVAYRMENAASPGEALCDSAAALRFRRQLGSDHPRFIKHLDEVPKPVNDLVIPIRGETYDEDGNPRNGGEWNHLACIDDALAKRSLRKMNVKSDPEASRAALRLLLADYCGGFPATLRGVAIGDGPLEARWSSSGAVCLSEPRLLYAHGNEPTVPTKLPPRLEERCPGECTLDQWRTALRTCTYKDPAKNKIIPMCEDQKGSLESHVGSAP